MKKQLWRRWRRWKKALWVGAACAVLTVLAWRGMQVPKEISGLLTDSASTVTDTFDSLRTSTQMDDDQGDGTAPVFKAGENTEEDKRRSLSQEELLQTLTGSGISRTVHLKTTYVSGEEIQTLKGKKTPEQLEVLIAEHADWAGWISPEGDLWLEKRVDDLSPLTKRDAYIGVDEHGNLKLFKGPPVDEKVLKTFFQLDMGSMKSSLPEDMWRQLQEGIRIQDIEEYNSVLSTFSDYARDSAEQVMQNRE
ncbi:BofC C-terminal domain-containing protein [Paenibacillus albidus]|uniref:BofC C-terminal domain-containing protein n=1 Tax=Paenibacillus albidus TaxID=2041023 RepID=UPI001BEBC54B|nr:BofC C-terminal domain-containing protein [Paenibacillus albidus]MBT2288884.1 BofC C-terminal domain-containing protein [Paenibacillus albidus]